MFTIVAESNTSNAEASVYIYLRLHGLIQEVLRCCPDHYLLILHAVVRHTYTCFALWLAPHLPKGCCG